MEIINTIMPFLLFVLTLATGIIGFFLSRLVHSVDKMNDNFIAVAQNMAVQTEINRQITEKAESLEDKIDKINTEMNRIQNRLIRLEGRFHEPS